MMTLAEDENRHIGQRIDPYGGLEMYQINKTPNNVCGDEKISQLIMWHQDLAEQARKMHAECVLCDFTVANITFCTKF